MMMMIIITITIIIIIIIIILTPWHWIFLEKLFWNNSRYSHYCVKTGDSCLCTSLCAFLASSMYATCSAHSILPHLINLVIFCEYIQILKLIIHLSNLLLHPPSWTQIFPSRTSSEVSPTCCTLSVGDEVPHPHKTIRNVCCSLVYFIFAYIYPILIFEQEVLGRTNRCRSVE
jgi:hypothetical protein